MSEDFNSMSVIELRKAAKEMGVKLGAGINKQGIIEKLTEAREKAAPAAPALPAHRPVRSASIITDDEPEEEDVPVLTANVPVQRPAAPRPATPASSPVPSSLSGISAKAPAFTMEGSRAWHNPRPYQNAPGGYQRNQNWNTPRPAQTAPGARSYGAPMQQQARPAAPSYVPRFGPEQPQEAQQPAYPAQQQGYQQQGYPQQQQGYQGYQQEQRGGYYGGARDYQPGEIRQEQQGGYAHPSSYRAAPAPGPSLPELLTAGDAGEGGGILEIQPEGYGLLRTKTPGKKDIYISAAQISRFSLRSGDRLTGRLRPQRESDRYTAMLYLTDINGHAAEENKNRPAFVNFTPIYPKKRINLSGRSQDSALRLIDLLSPIGFGQRALISCAPRADRTGMLKKLAAAVSRNYPKAAVRVLLVDEQPEDVTEMRDALKAEVSATTFDEPAEAQGKAVDLFVDQAQRLVEDGQDVVILVDSLTRLARLCNQLIPASARTLNGGLAAGALQRPKRCFGAARNTREAGSLTMIAFGCDETPLDHAVLEELGAVANMTLQLGAGEGLGFDPRKAVTRRDDLLLTPQELSVAQRIRAMTAGLSPEEAEKQLLSMLEKTESNEDLVQKFDSWMGA